MSPRSVSARLAGVRTDAQFSVEHAGVRAGQLAVRHLLDAQLARRATRAARVTSSPGTPSLEESPATMLLAAVLTKRALPGGVLAAVRHAAGL